MLEVAAEHKIPVTCPPVVPVESALMKLFVSVALPIPLFEMVTEVPDVTWIP